MAENSALLLPALALTIFIETGVAWLLAYRRKTEIAAVICVNVITNPALNYFLLLKGVFGAAPATLLLVLFLEAGIVFVEWLLLWFALRRDPLKILFLSFAMNACSYLAGVILFSR